MNFSSLFTTTFLTCAISAMAIVIPVKQQSNKKTIAQKQDELNAQLITLINENKESGSPIDGYVPQMLLEQPNFAVQSGLSGEDLDTFYQRVNEIIAMEVKKDLQAQSTITVTPTSSGTSTATTSTATTSSSSSSSATGSVTTTVTTTATDSTATVTTGSMTRSRTTTRRSTTSSNGASSLSSSVGLSAAIAAIGAAMVILQ